MLSSDDEVFVELRQRIARQIVRSGVPLDVIFSTVRFREDLQERSRLLLSPSGEESSDWEEDDGEDDDEESDDEDDKFLIRLTAASWNLSEYEYFVKLGGQEYGFVSWSVDGVRNLAFVLLVESGDPSPLPAVISPLSWLFMLAPSIQSLLQSADNPQVHAVSEAPPYDAAQPDECSLR